MEKQLQLKKIGCSNCGAELIFDPGTQMTNCNFCGSQFQIEKAQDEEIITPDGILPFKVTKENYEQAVLSWLSEGDYTPDDILNSTVFESVNGVYLPMWLYNVKYHGNWSASSGYKRREEYSEWSESKKKMVSKTRTVIDWRPSSGQCAGDLTIIAFAGIGKGIKSDIAVYAHDTSFSRGEMKPFDSKYTIGFNLVDFTIDEHSTWETLGKMQSDAQVKNDAKNRIPGDKYKDFYCDVIYDKDHPLRVYVPFWITYYKYNDKEFHVYMDGTTTTRIRGMRPEDQGRKDTIKKLKLKIIAIGILGSIGLGFVIGLISCLIQKGRFKINMIDNDKFYVPGLIAFVFIIIATFIFQKYKTNEILTKSKSKRQEILNNIRNSSE